jgi:phosphoenolpyruvate phosphomutase
MISVRSALRKSNGAIRLLEAHDRSSTKAIRDTNCTDGAYFEGIWISGLTQTTYLGIPDTEIVSPLYRAILQATTIKTLWPSDRTICAAFDADSGGPLSDIPALVAVLVTVGVSMVVIEDKELKAPGKKVNSLLTANGSQSQADPAEFCKTIQTFKECTQCSDLMVTARIESFNVRITKDDPVEEAASIKASLEDALSRAEIYTKAGADAIMIHSKSESPTEVLEFLKRFRERDQVTPLVIVPTTYSTTPRETLIDAGANVIIYANHLMRVKIKAVEEVMGYSCSSTPALFAGDKEAAACAEAGNYGCLMRILLEKDLEVEKDFEIRNFVQQARQLIESRMNNVAGALVMGTQSGCEADFYMISVEELLKINSIQVSIV